MVTNRWLARANLPNRSKLLRDGSKPLVAKMELLMHTSSNPVEPTFLTSWKEIAQYMGKGVRTVQRWEQRFQLPVQRVAATGYKATVLARPSDLDNWVSSPWAHRARRNSTSSPDCSNPALEKLKRNLDLSKDLHDTHLRLRAELSEALRSLLENCRQLSNNAPQMRTNIHARHLS